MSIVKSTAAQAQDLFYLTYSTSADFLQNGWWQRQCLITRNQLINDEFVASKKGDLDSQQELANLYEYFDADVTKVEDKIYQAIIPKPFFIFQYDRFSSGVQYISPTKTACGELIRIRRAEAWAACKSPIKNVVYWYVDTDRIKFINVQGGCLSKITIALIPSFDSLGGEICDQIVPDGIEAKVIAIVVGQAFDAWMKRNGRIDQTNNANANTSSDGEDGNVLKNERTT